MKIPVQLRFIAGATLTISPLVPFVITLRKNNLLFLPKNPFLQVYLIRPNKCQELAGTCRYLQLLARRLFKQDLTCGILQVLVRRFFKKDKLTSTCKIPQVTLTRSCLNKRLASTCKSLTLARS